MRGGRREGGGGERRVEEEARRREREKEGVENRSLPNKIKGTRARRR